MENNKITGREPVIYKGDTKFSGREPVIDKGKIKIAFTSQGEICIMNVDGSEQRRLTDLDVCSDWAPVFSPDGSKIAFSRHTKYNPAQIYIMNADGSDQRRLSKGDGLNTHPSFSPIPI